MMKQYIKGVIVVLLCAFSSCNSYKYFGQQVATEKKYSECDVTVYFLIPDYEYEEIGECLGKGFSFTGDGSIPAMKQLEKCACKYGGDAILIIKASDRELDTNNADGYSLSSSDFGVKFTGKVIRKK